MNTTHEPTPEPSDLTEKRKQIDAFERSLNHAIAETEKTIVQEYQQAILAELAEPDSEELAAFNLETCEGKGILDGGASKSVGGIEILDRLQDAYNRVCQEFDVLQSNVGFTFAGGEQAGAASTAVLHPSGFDAQPVGIHAVQRPSPILIGLDNLRYYELNIDYKYNTCWSHKLNKFLNVEILPSGHMAIDLGPAEQVVIIEPREE